MRRLPNSAPRLGLALVLTAGLGLAACGGGGATIVDPPPSFPGTPYRIVRTADIAQGVVTDVLEQGDRYEMVTDPDAIQQQELDMLAVLSAHQTWVALDTWSYPEFNIYPDGWFSHTDNITDPHSDYLTPYTFGLYFRNGSSTPLMAASIRWRTSPLEPALIVIVSNTRFAHATVASDGSPSILFYDQY